MTDHATLHVLMPPFRSTWNSRIPDDQARMRGSCYTWVVFLHWVLELQAPFHTLALISVPATALSPQHRKGKETQRQFTVGQST